MPFDPLPDWAHTIRPHQTVAVADIVDAFTRVNVVGLDAPTGSGKTLIADLVRRELDIPKTLYVASDKQLQDQFARDFPYAAILKGRNNYETEYGDSRTTAEDCTASSAADPCMRCVGYSSCPYQIAKRQALASELAVINTSYLLTEANGPGAFSKRPFIVADEADTLEDQLLSHIEYTIPQYIGRDLRLQYPIKGAHKPTLIVWLEQVAVAADMHLARNGSTMEVKAKKRWAYFSISTKRVIGELRRDVDEREDAGKWLRNYDTKTFSMQPVTVGGYGPMQLWRHGRKWLLMSASLISMDEMADSLGIALDWELVSVPMTFEIANRPILMAPVANVTFKAEDADYARLADAIDAIADRHPTDRILIHTVSYKLTDKMMELVDVPGRVKLTYKTARERADALAKFRATTGAMLFAPSMSRGVDLKDDDCRVIVIAKVPFPSLGDRRVSARRGLPGGQLWYMVQVVRSIVQMTGRAVRNDDDYAVTYILDRQFTTNVWSKWRILFPGWWKEAVDRSFNARKLTMNTPNRHEGTPQ